MLQATLEDVAARGLSDAITFKALSTGIKTVGKVRNILQERNLAKQSLRFAQLMTEDSPANVIAITKHESYAQDLRNAWRRAIDRIKNPHTEVVTPEGMVVKVPKEGNLHLMETSGKTPNSFSSKTRPKTVFKVNNMKEFFETEFGQILKKNVKKMKYRYDEQTIYELTQKIKNYGLDKGDRFYLDALHKDHIEVFSKTGDLVGVFNLDGTFNQTKYTKARGRTLKIK